MSIPSVITTVPTITRWFGFCLNSRITDIFSSEVHPPVRVSMPLPGTVMRPILRGQWEVLHQIANKNRALLEFRFVVFGDRTVMQTKGSQVGTVSVETNSSHSRTTL